MDVLATFIIHPYSMRYLKYQNLFPKGFPKCRYFFQCLIFIDWQAKRCTHISETFYDIIGNTYKMFNNILIILSFNRLPNGDQLNGY